MSKSYKVAKKTINMGEKKGQTLFSVRPYSYGTLTTEEVANQIAVESTATPADVKAVLDRYAYYVKENLKKGYDIELLGFGKLYIGSEFTFFQKLTDTLCGSFPRYNLCSSGIPCSSSTGEVNAVFCIPRRKFAIIRL